MNRAWLSFGLLGVSAAAGVIPLGCSSSPTQEKKTLTAQDLRDPTSCQPCHAGHYSDWSKSMHAYASDDPVFLAMNARGQKDTNGALGSFCVQCHAPVALKDGLTHDGTNLATVAKAEKGVTCFFCHSIDSVGASHVNADVTLASDLVLRGEIKKPQDNPAHASTYSAFQDDQQADSAQMCGSCHDIVSPAGGHIERTFHEWSASIFATSVTTCAFNGNCHMAASTSQIPIASGGPPRIFHAHDFPAVDIAFDPAFPQTPADQQTKVEASLANVLTGALCVNARGGVRVILDNNGAAHSWPSGAAQDRRAWVEVVASSGGTPFYRSGSVAPGTPVGSDPNDKDLWLLRDQMFDSNGAPVDMFWQAACAGGNELTAIANDDSTNQANYTHRTRLYPNTPNPGDSVLAQMPDQVTATVHLQPIGLDVLADLADSGLDPSVAAQMPTLTVALPNESDAGGGGTSLVWTPQTAVPGFMDQTQGQSTAMSCVTTPGFNVVAAAPTAADPPAKCPAQPAASDAGL
ncbi:MAG TPA: multiheme c-type cytochrome [Polyangiaceae bacterium]|jgi:hypothetical protein|nr:multiheme c-type cytochrome [Polyangiaceae bacterium]